MTETETTFAPPPPIPVPQVPVDRHGSITLDVLAANPDLGWLFTSPSRPPTEAEQARYESRRDNPEWAWLYELAAVPVPVADPEPGEDAAETNWRLTAITSPPVAEPVPPAENDGLALTESGHEEHEFPAATAEGAAADADLPRPGPSEPLSPAVSGETGDGSGPGQPDETALIPVADDFTQVIETVTDSTEGSGS